jgi:hypothetical protein
MLKCVTALSAALIAGWALVGFATDASAGHHHGHHKHHHHGCCGPIPPKVTYKTKTVHKHVTHHRDVTRTRYVPRIKRIVHVTRIQPIVHVHNVTRVHTRLVGVVRPVHERVVQRLPARRFVTSSVVYLRPHCGCGY